MAETEVLLVGESLILNVQETFGFDRFSTSRYEQAMLPLQDALEEDNINTTHMPNHVAQGEFPAMPEELSKYDAVVLSDVGYNTLAVPPVTWDWRDHVYDNKEIPNRLDTIETYVRAGGALLMIGGYMSFMGFEGKANYYASPIEDILPVSLERWDDRAERSGGVRPDIVDSEHEIMAGVSDEWPPFRGYNRVTADEDGTVVARIDGDPFLVVTERDHGRAAAFTSDALPHWGPPEFLEWDHYPRFWTNLVDWLAAE